MEAMAGRVIRAKVRVRGSVVPLSSRDLVNIMVRGGAKLSGEGDLVITVRKGFFSKKEVKYFISYGLLGEEGEVFFFREVDSGEVFLTGKFRQVEGDTVLIESECKLEALKELCKEVIEVMKKGLSGYGGSKEAGESGSREGTKRKFSISGIYSNLLDGFAEVTLSSAILRFPLVWTGSVRVDDIADIESFLERLINRYGRRKYIVMAGTDTWKFVVGFDATKGEYTTSFISWKSGERLLGYEAIDRLRRESLHIDKVNLVILEMEENELS